jgi:hypothetical protein
MIVELFAVNKKSRKCKTPESWVGGKKYPIYQLGEYDMDGKVFSLLSGFPIQGIPEFENFKFLYIQPNGTVRGVVDGGDITFSIKG